MLLDTSTPGNIGLVADADTTLFVDVDHDRIYLRDQTGHVADLRAVDPSEIVVSGDGWIGPASRDATAGAPVAHRGVDVAGQSEVLARDVSVQWIGTITPAAGMTDGRVVVRGLGGSSGERRSWGVSIDTATSYPAIRVIASWETVAGSTAGVTLELPASAPTGWTLWTVTRRWESATSVVVRVYAGDTLLAEGTSTAGAIGGSTAATTEVLGGSGYNGQLQQLRVVAREISADELRQTWARLTRWQPEGEAAFRALAPPGISWFRSADSTPAKFSRIAGQALGFAAAAGHALRETFLPAWASRDTIARWERLVGARPGAVDSLDVRRARVVELMARDNGYSVPALQELLAEAFGLDAADVEIREFAPAVEDNFATIDTRRWLASPAASWSVVSGDARVQAASGDDVRIAPGAINGPTLELPVEVARDSYTAAQVTVVDLPLDCEAGLIFRHGGRGDRLFFGLRRTGASDYDVVYQRWRRGALVDAAPVALATTTATVASLRVRLAPPPAALVADGDLVLQLEWDVGAGWQTEPDVTWVDDWNLAGFYARSDDAATSDVIDVRFDKLLHLERRGPRCLRWWAYRDPGLGGTWSLERARSLVRRAKPSHTLAGAVSELDVLCDDAAHGCDVAPLGPL